MKKARKQAIIKFALHQQKIGRPLRGEEREEGGKD